MKRVWLAALALLAACPRQEPRPDDNKAAVEPSPPPTPSADCVVHDMSGRGEPVEVSSLHDPVATKVLAAAATEHGGCPSTYAEVAAKLRETDAAACDDSGMFSALQTVLVSERAQLRRTFKGKKEGCTADPIAMYRAITTRFCGERPKFGLFMALFGMTAEDPELPADTELIGWDEAAGVFNYYAVEQGKWSYFGNSIDMLQGPTEKGERRCAACHTGGGLVLKEMRNPWVYWEGRDTLPGVTEILGAHEDLGSRAKGKVLDLRPAGKEIEDTVTAGNAAWTETRIDHLLKDGSTKDLLRPLFCSQEVELRAVAQSVTPPASTGGEKGTLPVIANELLVDPYFEVDETVGIPLPDYHAALTKANQRVERACGTKLADADGKPLRDTAFDLTHPFRSLSDEQMIAALEKRGVIDRRLAEAILSVDFTRPVFSKARCALLDHVPDVPAPDRKVATIRTALIAAMKAEPKDNEAAATLLAALDGTSPPTDRLTTFINACKSRRPKDLAVDLLEDITRRRTQARKLPIIELPEMLPTTDLPAPEEGALDPKTCQFRESL